MSLFFTKPVAGSARSISYQDVWGRGLDLGPARTQAGVTVTTDASMRHAALWSSVHLLASTVSTMPVDVMGPGAFGPAVSVVRDPSRLVSRREWVYQGMISLLLNGNAYGVVMARDQNQQPTIIEWADPNVVTVTQIKLFDQPVYRVGGQDVDADDILHLRAFVRPGSAVGRSPITYHAEQIGVGLGAQAFGAKWFGDGAHPSAILQNEDQTIDPVVAASVKERFMASLRGRREPVVLGKGWKYQQIQVSANESQFLETMGYTDAQIARIFGPGVAEVLGYETGGSMTYSNREQRTQDLLVFSIQPWLVKFEDAQSKLLPSGMWVKYNFDSLLRADTLTRHQVYQIDRNIGLRSIDEIRALEDEPPLPKGAGADYTPLIQPAATGGPNAVK